MKKLFYLFLAATMFVGVVACGQTEEAPVEEVTEVEEVVEAPVEAPAEAPVDSAAAPAEAAPAEAAPAQ